MKQYGLIGYPLTSSFSKKYFLQKFQEENIRGCAYENYPLASIGLFPSLIKNTPHLKGLNVTIPYKKEVMAYLDDATGAVRQMNACNCIKVTSAGLVGYNTDVTGFEKSFVPYLQSVHDKAMVLGTGGASEAVKFVLNNLRIPFLSITRDNTSFPQAVTYRQLDKQLLNSYKIIINTTPVGMFPDVHQAPPIPYEFVTADHYLYDLVYNPAETQFLKEGMKVGAITKNGADMLVIQAEESWKIWNAM